MNKADFISLIEQPDTLGDNHIPALKNIAADFPYFQGAQVLLTKALYNEKHYEFEKQLKYASLMVPDRAVLFRYIHNLTEAAVQQTVEIPVVMPEPETVVETVIDTIEIPEVIIPEPEVAPLAIHETKTIVEEIVEQVVLPETIHEEPIVEEAPELTEIAIVTEPASPEVESHEEKPIVDAAINEPVLEEEPLATEPEKVAPITETAPNETHSFAEWLQLQAQQVTRPAEKQQSLPPVEPMIVQPEEIKDETPTIETIREEIAGQVERSSNVVEFESILDKFIRENPKISRGKAEFYSPVNMAKQSVEQDEELVTETLANIYYKQGHYKKAIRAYEKLCLLYPHKLPYFADLIQKIKTENKD